MNSTQILGVLFFFVGVLVFLMSYFYLDSTGSITFREIINDSYLDITTSLLTISLTILVIDHLNNKRAMAIEKRKLVQGLRSTSRGILESALEDLRVKNWLEDGSLSGINLNGVVLSDLDLRHANLDSANFMNGTLNNVNFEFAILANANLRWVSSNRCNFNRTSLLGAKLSSGQFTLCSFSPASLSELSIAGAEFIETDFSNAEMCGITFEKKTHLLNCNFDHCNLIASIIQGCDLTSSYLCNADVRRVEIRHSTLKKTILHNIIGGSVVIEDCDFTNSEMVEGYMEQSTIRCSIFVDVNYRSCKFKNTTFEDCDFSGAKLSDCDFRHTAWINCNLTNADLSGTDLRAADLTQAITVGASFEGANTHGMRSNR